MLVEERCLNLIQEKEVELGRRAEEKEAELSGLMEGTEKEFQAALEKQRKEYEERLEERAAHYKELIKEKDKENKRLIQEKERDLNLEIQKKELTAEEKLINKATTFEVDKKAFDEKLGTLEDVYKKKEAQLKQNYEEHEAYYLNENKQIEEAFKEWMEKHNLKEMKFKEMVDIIEDQKKRIDEMSAQKAKVKLAPIKDVGVKINDRKDREDAELLDQLREEIEEKQEGISELKENLDHKDRQIHYLASILSKRQKKNKVENKRPKSSGPKIFRASS